MPRLWRPHPLAGSPAGGPAEGIGVACSAHVAHGALPCALDEAPFAGLSVPARWLHALRWPLVPSLWGVLAIGMFTAAVNVMIILIIMARH